MESTATFSFYGFIGFFGFFPVNRVLVCSTILNFLVNLTHLILMFFHESFSTSLRLSKAWLVIFLFIIIHGATSNCLILLEFFVKRNQVRQITIMMKKLLKPQNISEEFRRHILSKYLPLILASLVSTILFIYNSLLFPWYVQLINLYYVGFWTSRLLLLMICEDIVKIKLVFVLKEVENLVQIGMISEEMLYSLQRDYNEAKQAAEDVNKMAALSLFGTVLQYSLMSINLFYWFFLAVFKNLRYYSDLRKCIFVCFPFLIDFLDVLAF